MTRKIAYWASTAIVVVKPAAAIVLLLPGLQLLKEWAYAGVTFALVMAFISAYTVGEGPQTWANRRCSWRFSSSPT